jgi:protein AroM
MVKIGLLTIGQSPRVDILLDWKMDENQIKTYEPMDILIPPKDSMIPTNVELIHIGALDDIPKDKIHEIQPAPGKRGPISRLKDGTWTLIDPEKLKPLMIKCVSRLEKVGCQAILQLCTGDFPYLTPKIPLIEAGELCKGIIEAVLNPDSTLGMFSPFPQKTEEVTIKELPHWGNRKICQINANPYQNPPESIIPEVEKMKNQEVDMVYMNCLGYSIKHKKIAKDILKKPVILPRSTAARVIAELYGDQD